MSASDEVIASYSGNSSDNAHDLRITSHGKIRAWVEFSLDFLQKNPEKPLSLHTLPAAKGKAPARGEATGGEVQLEAATSATQDKSTRMHTSTSMIPRLVSVVEIIKREYLKTLDPALSDAGKLSGLHQYNEVDALDDIDSGDSIETAEEKRQKELAAVLRGKRHLRQHKIAYMRVTLCRRELPHLLAKGATYQKPQVRALSKSARARLKKRLRKQDMVE
ncbi:uncharacterized protein FIBRA_06875 [Fibroporia radiculosa]|uniref:Uncharacterized protein n=1 Tax=Fibroporia radiculosa TaxID=599839 RepID=J4H4B2_9APHY|nr:uncharacterized protein FIBRA_06875 [Fibroporia radiculosa]CCM04689.1 predicted protein [Fibroporia radiculosa]